MLYLTVFRKPEVPKTDGTVEISYRPQSLIFGSVGNGYRIFHRAPGVQPRVPLRDIPKSVGAPHDPRLERHDVRTILNRAANDPP